MPKFVYPAVCSVLALAAFALTGCGSSGNAVVPLNTAAIVNGKPITKAVLSHWLSIAAAAARGAHGEKPVASEPPGYTACVEHLRATSAKSASVRKSTAAQLKRRCETQYKSLLKTALDQLIQTDWIFAEAESLGIEVSDAEVHSHLEKEARSQLGSQAELNRLLETSHETASDLLLTTKRNLLLPKIEQRIVATHSKVTETQIAQYYGKHKEQYGTRETRDLRVILTKTEAQAKLAKKEVEAGKSFAAVAKKRSTLPGVKKSAGLARGVMRAQLPGPIGAALFSVAKGELSGPLKTRFGYYIYEVVSITPGTQQSLSQVKQKIQQLLESTSEQKALTHFVSELRSRWIGKTECAAAYKVSDCK